MESLDQPSTAKAFDGETFRQLIKYSIDTFVLLDADGQQLFVSESCEKVHGYKPEELTGIQVIDVMLHPDDRDRVRAAFIEALRNGSSTVQYRHKKKPGGWVHLEAVASNQLANEHIRAVVINVRDITERKLAEERIQALLREKEMILREVHHRIKNNLNAVFGLLTIQSQVNAVPAACETLKEAAGRVRCMGLLYDRLYQSDDTNKASMREYLTALINDCVFIFSNGGLADLSVEIDDISMPAGKLSTIGLIMNELVTNSLKHAFEGRKDGKISVSAKAVEGRVMIEYCDNGNGFHAPANPETAGRFGLQLIEMLVKQLGAKLIVEKGRGTRYAIEFQA